MSEPTGIRQVVLGEQVADVLRRMIVTGRYASGDPLVEGQLAERFQLSRGPIRDALKTLAAEGLIDTSGRTATVVGLTADDIDELFSLREAMERLALGLALERNRAALHADLTRTNERMRQAAEAGDVNAFAAADLTFHSVFYENAGHRRLSDVWSQYRPTIETLLLASNERYVDLGPSLAAHELLARLIAGDDTRAVFDELHAHLDNTRRRLREPYLAPVDDSDQHAASKEN